MSAESLRAALSPASIAVIGASDQPAKPGGRPIAFLRQYGFAGAVYPVNPGRDTVQGHSRAEGKWRITMTVLKMIVVAALMSTISATSALANDPDAFQAMFPDRDVLNGGALTPAGRAGLEAAGGAAGGYAAGNANAGIGSASPSLRTHRHHSRPRNGHLPRP